MDRTEREYHTASGCCLNAMQSLRRFAGTEAIAELRQAIRIIEQEQLRAARENRGKFRAAPSSLQDNPF